MGVILRIIWVPEGYVQYKTKLAMLTRAAVITPFGATEKFRGVLGLSQVGTHFCALWNGFIDIKAEMQYGMARGGNGGGWVGQGVGAADTTLCGWCTPLCI